MNSYFKRSIASRLADFKKAKAGKPVYYKGNGFDAYKPGQPTEKHFTPLAVHPVANGEAFQGCLRWIEQAENVCRSIRFCDKVASHIRHKGWFLDDVCQDETARGVVFSLPHGKFSAGIADPFNFDNKSMSGPCMVAFDEVFDEEKEAAYAANRLAELYAENEREFQAEQREEAEREEAEREAAERLAWEERDVETVGA